MSFVRTGDVGSGQLASVLERLAADFPPADIETRPDITCEVCRAAAEGRSSAPCVEHDSKRCKTCKRHLTTAHAHVSYVGHARVTRRLNDAAPGWTWEPMPNPPNMDGLWIRLMVTDENGIVHTRPGVGTRREPKEAIGDALRNAAMRFGVALALWERDDEPDAPRVRGRRGLSKGDPREPIWDFIKLVHQWAGRGSSQSVLDHWDAWRAQANVGTPTTPIAAPADIADAPRGTLLTYLAATLAETGQL